MAKPITILSTGGLSPAFLTLDPEQVQLDIIPFIQVIPKQDNQLREKINELSAAHHISIFTSGNAVDAVRAMLTRRPDWKIYCIGHETRKKVVAFFGEQSLLGSEPDAIRLAERIIRDQPSEQLLFFCGDRRREELPEALRKNKIPIEEIIVYETRLKPVPVSRFYDAILFFSPSAVASFFSLNRIPKETVLFALGSTTAAELKRQTNNEVILSVKPDKRSVLETAIDYYQSHLTA
ncbi:MAG TPA: uroporphyrinogen-III synthase [Puia sp.]|nr:uroporphyrinogen-III synthase [Puia sp.]